MSLDSSRLIARLEQLGKVGAVPKRGRTRLAFTEEDRIGRDLIKKWMQEAGCKVAVDAIGNIHGVLPGRDEESAPIMTGSHIDTVRQAGALDGCYGVVAGIEVLAAIAKDGEPPPRTLITTAFSNEEGVRFAPDLLGSRVMTKEIGLEDAHRIRSADGFTVKEELGRIGYLGSKTPWDFLPSNFIELHIEQGPVLESRGVPIGIVDSVQGYSWWAISVRGRANHAGTTPMDLRMDAADAAMRLIQKVITRAKKNGLPSVATVGTFSVEPSAINVVPGCATFTLDLRDPSDQKVAQAEAALTRAIAGLRHEGFLVDAQRTARCPAVRFSSNLCSQIEHAASSRSLETYRMTSGASHDAQAMSRVCQTAMIFVPSKGGISHNPLEFTDPGELINGANVLADVVKSLAYS